MYGRFLKRNMMHPEYINKFRSENVEFVKYMYHLMLPDNSKHLYSWPAEYTPEPPDLRKYGIRVFDKRSGYGFFKRYFQTIQLPENGNNQNVSLQEFMLWISKS